MSKSESPLKTVITASILCIVCSVLVSTFAVKLRPLQIKNQELDVKKNILSAAGLLKEGLSASEIEEGYSNNIEELLVDFETGQRASGDIKSFDMNAASKITDMSIEIPKGIDKAGLGRRSKKAKIYLIKKDQLIEGVILPISSKGLWSTMLGFLALEKDLKTVKGFAYYSHGETPGLGGEVDNPKWKKQWVGKQVYDASQSPKVRLAKNGASNEYEVDALSGATITSQGIETSFGYWLGDHAYKKILNNIASGRL